MTRMPKKVRVPDLAVMKERGETMSGTIIVKAKAK